MDKLANQENTNEHPYKGIFWIVGSNNLENNDPYLFKILANRNGDVLVSCGNLNSKKGDNYNHKKTWELLPKTLTHNKQYNYYPRGRVEIKNDTAKIFVNPFLNKNVILEYIKKEYNINNMTISCLIIIIDNGNHYQSN